MTIMGLLVILQLFIACCLGMFAVIVATSRVGIDQYMMVVGCILTTVLVVCISTFNLPSLVLLWLDGFALGLMSGLVLGYAGGIGRL